MESLHYLLMKSHAMVHRRVTSKTSSIGLTSGQPKVLDFLLRFHEADQKTIAAYCEIEPATVGSILSRMETSGLVVRRQKEGNRRSLYVSLTEKGVNAAEKLTEIFRSVEDEATCRLSEDERDTLRELLSRICDTLSGPEASDSNE
ncbi:MAG: MarR family winged helix-turn-helix transcriptional regulator [Anaerovoracaceae bacterium]